MTVGLPAVHEEAPVSAVRRDLRRAQEADCGWLCFEATGDLPRERIRPATRAEQVVAMEQATQPITRVRASLEVVSGTAMFRWSGF